jgi:glutathione S-transferase
MDELEAISMMGWFSGGIHPHLTRIFNPTKFCDAPGSEDSTRTLAKNALEKNFARLTSGLPAANSSLIISPRWTDISFGARAAPPQRDLEVDGYVNVVAHHNRLHQRNSVKKALAFEKETMAGFAKT